MIVVRERERERERERGHKSVLVGRVISPESKAPASGAGTQFTRRVS
jgi:hypothetical protein